jgi:hypothetical protein
MLKAKFRRERNHGLCFQIEVSVMRTQFQAIARNARKVGK